MFRMTELTNEVRVGINGRGDLNIEIREKDAENWSGDTEEIYVPADALPELFEFLRREG